MNKFQIRILLFWLTTCIVLLCLPTKKQFYKYVLTFELGENKIDEKVRRAQIDAKVKRMLDSLHQEELRALIAEVNAWEGDTCFLDSIAIIEDGIPLDIQIELKHRKLRDTCEMESNFTFLVTTRSGI